MPNNVAADWSHTLLFIRLSMTLNQFMMRAMISFYSVLILAQTDWSSFWASCLKISGDAVTSEIQFAIVRETTTKQMCAPLGSLGTKLKCIFYALHNGPISISAARSHQVLSGWGQRLMNGLRSHCLEPAVGRHLALALKHPVPTHTHSWLSLTDPLCQPCSYSNLGFFFFRSLFNCSITLRLHWLSAATRCYPQAIPILL